MTLSELNSMINSLNDQQLSAEDLVRLEKELMSNPSSMKHYLAMMDIENLLHHQSKLNDHIIKPVVSVNRILKHQSIATWKRVALSTAALLLIGIVVLSLLNTTTKDALTFKLGPDTRYSISHQKDSKQPAGLAMQKGSRLNIEYGSIELNFDSGVRAVVKAPAEIELLESDEIRMRFGTAWYHVPSGAEGFTVLTDELRVVDLGTEFGIKADLNQLDEVHVMKGKVKVSALRARKSSTELIAGEACIIDSIGRLEQTPLRKGLFSDQLPTSQRPYVVLEDQFNDRIGNWVMLKGLIDYHEGDFNNSDCHINTLGESDHSSYHFDPSGKEIKATGEGYIALGKESKSTTVITSRIRLFKDRRYTVFFRHAGSHNSSQKITATVASASEILAQHSYHCSDQKWTSSSFSFTTKADSVASINFSNIGSTDHLGSDTLLDSVLMVSSPLNKDE